LAGLAHQAEEAKAALAVIVPLCNVEQQVPEHIQNIRLTR
jgi:hypothetical protein